MDLGQEQGWRDYGRSLLVFTCAGSGLLYVILRTQGIHPLNPQGLSDSSPWDLSFNTASSFVSNTSWQYYAGETARSDFSQTVGIAVGSGASGGT